MKKRIIFVILLVLIIVSASVTYAYIVRESTAETVITFGSLKLKLHYYTLDNDKEVEIKEDDNLSIYGMNKLSRMVRLENIGGHSMYVRVKLDIKDSNNHDISNIITINELDNWIYDDGYYYYKYELNPGEMTTKLMDEIIFNKEEVTNNYRGMAIKFKINAEAVQAEHNESDVLEAKGWPK